MVAGSAAIWSQWPWLTAMHSISPNSMPRLAQLRRKMAPSGPVSNSITWRSDSGGRCQPAAKAEICAQQRLARQRFGAGADDVRKLRYREQRLADVIIADIVGDDIDRQLVERAERAAGLVRFYPRL